MITSIEQAKYSQPIQVNVPSLSAKISVPYMKLSHDFMVTTTYTRASVDTDSLYVKVTTIEPANIVVNQTRNILLITQEGQTEKQTEVIMPD